MLPQVRQIGRLLGVPEQFIKRHPFPGPGLAVRVLGDVTDGDKMTVLREVDEIYINTIKEFGLYDEIWQVRPPPPTTAEAKAAAGYYLTN